MKQIHSKYYITKLQCIIKINFLVKALELEKIAIVEILDTEG